MFQNNPRARQIFLRTMGETIRRHRQAANLSQKALARACGFSASHLSQVENGVRDLSIIQLYRLANALKTKPVQLVAQAEQRFKEALHSPPEDTPPEEPPKPTDG